MSARKQEWNKKVERELKQSGFNCGKKDEPLPMYIQADCEHVLSGENGSYIILGRDRPADRSSGYGGKGHHSCAHIDIIVGRHGYKDKEIQPFKSPGASDMSERNEQLNREKYIYAEPNINLDAARIYISQKTQVDTNFDIKSTKGAPTPRLDRGPDAGKEAPRSAVGVKADLVRIVARENIRLVTGTAARTSQGEPIDAPGGIDLIAGDDNDDVQPLVKGDNLCRSMKRLRDHINKLSGLLSKFIEHQQKFNEAIMQHTHHSPFLGIPTFFDFETVMPEGTKATVKTIKDIQVGVVKHKTNMHGWASNWFSKSGGSKKNKKFICSEHNHTN